MDKKENSINIPFLAEMLIEFIKKLDAVVFAEKPYETIILEASELTEQDKKILEEYVSRGEPLIYFSSSLKKYGLLIEGFENTVNESLNTIKHPDARKNFEDLFPLTLEEMVLNIAAHEVRHRVQKEMNIEILTPGDEINAINSNLKALLEQESFVFKARNWGSKDFYEYDALVVGRLTASLWHTGTKDFKSLGSIIKKNGKKILKKDNVLFFLFNLI